MITHGQWNKSKSSQVIIRRNPSLCTPRRPPPSIIAMLPASRRPRAMRFPSAVDIQDSSACAPLRVSMLFSFALRFRKWRCSCRRAAASAVSTTTTTAVAVATQWRVAMRSQTQALFPESLETVDGSAGSSRCEPAWKLEITTSP